MLRILCLSVLIALLAAGAALASDFDGMTVAQIRANPDFVASDYSLSGAANSGDPGAKHVYWWIGYIPVGDKRVYFDSFGEPLTCIKWEKTGEWVPEWVAKALDKLVEGGYIVLGETLPPFTGPSTPAPAPEEKPAEQPAPEEGK